MNILGFWHHQIVFVQDSKGTLGFLDTPWRGAVRALPMFFVPLQWQLWECRGGSGAVLAPPLTPASLTNYLWSLLASHSWCHGDAPQAKTSQGAHLHVQTHVFLFFFLQPGMSLQDPLQEPRALPSRRTLEGLPHTLHVTGTRVLVPFVGDIRPGKPLMATNHLSKATEQAQDQCVFFAEDDF